MNAMDDQLRSAILGAIIGNTLGAPLRGRTDYHKLNFYEPIPLRMSASEALDAWIVWSNHLGRGLPPELLSRSLHDGWIYRTQETAFGLANMDRGLTAPLSGRFQNPIGNGSQAFGRAVFWGLVFSGLPDRAAEFAYYDASIDHSGDSVACSVALAFAVATASPGVAPTQLVRAASAGLPLDSPALRLVTLAVRSATNGDGPQAARDAILDAIDHQDAYDASLNFGYILIGLLQGGGDFSNSVKIVASMGGASDQNAMVVGAMLGSTAKVEGDWLEPIGQDYISGHGLRGIDPPETIDEFIAAIERVKVASPISAETAAPVPTEPLPEAPKDDLDVAAAQAPVEPEVPAEDLEKAAVEAPPDLDAPAVENPSDAGPAAPKSQFPTNVRGLILSQANICATTAGGATIKIEFVDGPTAYPGKNSQLVLTFVNDGAEEITFDPRLEAPAGWSTAHKLASFRLRAGESSNFPVVVQPPKDAEGPSVSQVRLSLGKEVITIPFVSAQRWYTVGPFENIEGTGFDKAYRPMDVQTLTEVFNGRSNQPVRWIEGQWPGVLFDLEPQFKTGPGTLFLWGKLTFANPGKLKMVCAASTGVIAYVDRQKLIWYQDTHRPVPRAILPYSAEIDTTGEITLLLKVLRNKEPLLPLVLYFIAEDGSIVTPQSFGTMS